MDALNLPTPGDTSTRDAWGALLNLAFEDVENAINANEASIATTNTTLTSVQDAATTASSDAASAVAAVSGKQNLIRQYATQTDAAAGLAAGEFADGDLVIVLAST